MRERNIRKVIKQLSNSYFVWRYLKNGWPTLSYKRMRKPLSEVEHRILSELTENGIAITHANELLGDLSIYEDLCSFVTETENLRSAEIEQARKNADEVSVKKDFLFQLLGDKPVLNSTDVNVRFALQDEILNIVNAYFGCLTKLKFYNIWHTFVTRSGPKRSMFWHNDPEDKWIIKVFLYLSDVDDGAGPFVYAPQTHPKGSIKTKPAWFKEPGRGAERSTDEQMAEVVPATKWLKATGRRGTIIFADTKGYHKGGFATTTDRIMYNCLFVSPASRTSEVFQRAASLNEVAEDNPQKKYALSR